MKEIVKKCDSEFFEKILSGDKKFEVRLADEEYNEGDILILKEVDVNKQFTGREIKKEVTLILKTKDISHWPKEDIDKFGFVVLNLK